MSDKGRSPSSSSSDPSRESNKAPRNSISQSGPSGRQRRAARACERCRSSKLRCEAGQGNETRCGQCVKSDSECRYANPVPLHISQAASLVDVDNGGQRLSALENNVARLLEIMERGNQAAVSGAQPMPAIQPPRQGATTSAQQPRHDFQPAYPTTYNEQNRVNDWMGSSSAQDQVDQRAATADLNNFFDTYLVQEAEGAAHPTPSVFAPRLASDFAPVATNASRVQFAPPIGISPNELSDHRRTPHSQTEPLQSEAATQARPIPDYGGNSRIAALNDPSAPEAPFRSLTYNPDTYRNAEMTDKDENGFGAGGKTPKRGRGDPIDRGVFTEEHARALFQFYQEEIFFFLPICQEPLTFDFVRHRSSFLLATILAIAAKYCCSTTKSSSDLPGLFSASPAAPAVKTVDERAWIQIRALAMSSYFQATISKVHCLEDVQATLLLAAWGLQDRAFRLARRLGIHLAPSTLAAGAPPTARLVASWKTYMCLYAFDRFFTVGFGRPETDGLGGSVLDLAPMSSLLQDSAATPLSMCCTSQSAACITAYVELANLAQKYSFFVKVSLKAEPAMTLNHLRTIAAELDLFASRWLWARSPLSGKLGRAIRPIKMLYNHIRLCLHAIPLKPDNHPDSQSFLQQTRLMGSEGHDVLAKCLKKAQDSAVAIVQDFADDLRDDNDTVILYGYDYVYMVLAHSAALLLNLSRVGICGLAFGSYESPASTGTVEGSIDRNMARRYCALAIASMVEPNRSANLFPVDMAGNLSLIAKETGMVLREWTSDNVVRRIEARAAENEGVASALAAAADDLGGSGIDFSLFTDLDFFLQPGFFEDGAAFS